MTDQIEVKHGPMQPSTPGSPVSYDDVVHGSGPLGFAPVSSVSPAEPRRQLKDPIYLLVFIAHVVALVAVGSHRATLPFRSESMSP